MAYTLNDVFTVKNLELSFLNKTDGISIPLGNTLERPSLPQTGTMRFNTDASFLEVFVNGDWMPINTFSSTSYIITNVLPRHLPRSTDIAVVTGSNFSPNMHIDLIGSLGSSHQASYSFINSTTISFIRPSLLSPSENPYSLRITWNGGSGPQYELTDIIEVGTPPFFMSPATGIVGFFAPNFTIPPITFTAYDLEDDQNILSITTDGVVAGLTLTYNGGNVATLSGVTQNVANFTEYNFTVSATDTGNNTVSREFTIHIKPDYDTVLLSDGLVLYLDINKANSYSSGATWSDLGPLAKHFTFTAEPSIVTESGKNGMKAFVASGGVNGVIASGQGANTFGITNTSGHTIFYLAKTNTLTDNCAFRFRAFSTDRGIYVQPTGVYSYVTWDQGGFIYTTTSHSRAFVSVNQYWNSYVIYAFQCQVSSELHIQAERTIWANGIKLLTFDVNTPNINLASYPVEIGGTSAPSAQTWDANLSAFIAYNRSLSDIEIQTISQSFMLKYNL